MLLGNGRQMIPRQQIEKWCNQVAREFRPQKIILFGSYATGSPNEESDVDVLVVIPLVRGQRDVRLAAAIRDRVRASFPMDVIVRSPRDISRGLARGDKFITGIFRDGRVVYEGEHP